MDGNAGGSFIPKRSTGRVAPRRVGKRIYILSYIAYALFFGTLLSVAGIFLLTKQANAKLDSYKQQLSEARGAFNQDDMDRVSRLSAQLQAAQNKVETHLAPSLIFTELEKTVASSIQLHGLEYSKNSRGAQVGFNGSAESFDALLFQRTVMAESDIFGAAKVSNVTYGSESAEAVGASARSQLASVATAVQISFAFDDEALQDKIGYEPPAVVVPTADSNLDALEETILEETVAATTSSSTSQ